MGKHGYDFSQDPKVMAFRKKFSELNRPSPAGHSSSYSGSACKLQMETRHILLSKPETSDFRTASGRPLAKRMIPVITNDTENIGISVKERRFFQHKSYITPSTKIAAQQVRDATSASEFAVYRSLTSDHSLWLFQIISNGTGTSWADVAGLDVVKRALNEIIVLPLLRPDIFTGILAPPKGVLLFGPPGTGKTMIGRCVASQFKATFFNIAASSITSKWVGDGEKLVRALFAIARVLQPSVIFIDEVDSLLTTRKEGEHESSRRIKTEFLIHLDGVNTNSEDKLLILGATNRPQEIDSAARRRFTKRLFIDLPCKFARMEMINSHLTGQKKNLSVEELDHIAELTEGSVPSFAAKLHCAFLGYSGADMKQLCAEAAMIPIRNIQPISYSDFLTAMKFVRATVDDKDMKSYKDWNKLYGSFVFDTCKLKEIDKELETCTELQRRSALMDSKSDLIELISLLKESETTADEKSGDIGETYNIVETQDSGELVGMHCLAPYKRTVDQAIYLHDAVILDFVANSSEQEDGLKVKVLYGHPLETAMKPCIYFLDDRCNYGDECRFSHGEEVLFSALQDYQKLDSSLIKEDSIVLVEKENKLWSSARVVAVDDEKVAVCSLVTGKEIAVDKCKVYPVPQISYSSQDDVVGESVPSTSWEEYKQERRGNVTIGDIGDWEKHTRGIGTKLLLKMGYKIGQGLGRKSDGIIHAIQPVIFAKNKSLDACMEAKNRKVVDGLKTRQQYVKQTIAKHLEAVEQPVDVFDLLNQKLNESSVRPNSVDETEEIKKLQSCSSKNLGAQFLDLDKKLREYKEKERKLREGITRNSRDFATVDKLKKKLSACREVIQRLTNQQERLNTMVSSRRKKSDIF
ncbi:unnamed protein product [Thelazia callipaeda]|uniref:AAA domain-containing protein n=1 Tax=Thelazia callipaeda TaxID=103827 RepID=A0A0N5D8B4_THECL|nr:unnamed protein product [Thelazia callipaeda]